MLSLELIKKVNSRAFSAAGSVNESLAWHRNNHPKLHHGVRFAAPGRAPQGWFKLHAGTLTIRGDKFWAAERGTWVSSKVGTRICAGGHYIRRINTL